MLYKYGKIVSKNKNWVIFESHSTGYSIFTSMPESFKINATVRMYLYQYTTEYVSTIYGFSSLKERILFEDLIAISGVGPKTAISLLSNGFEWITSKIMEGDVASLTSMPMIGVRSANQIIFELSDKYKRKNLKISKVSSKVEILNSLKTLGFQKHQIEVALKKVNLNQPIELSIEQAIKLISNEKSVEA